MPLVDTNLLVRYYFDEDASGTGPTSVTDASGNAYHLNEIDYGGGNLAWTEISGNRGLESTATTGVQRARHVIDGTSDYFRDNAPGGTGYTIELVVRTDAMSVSGGRIFGVNDKSGSNGTLLFKGISLTEYFVSWNDVNGGSLDLDLTSRAVIHIVIDSTDTTQADRIKHSVNGATLSTSGNAIPLNDTLTLPSSCDLIAFNRQSAGSYQRSFDGVLFYAAIYKTVFTQGNVDTNYAILTADDDTPAAGGDSITLTETLAVAETLAKATGKTLLEAPTLTETFDAQGPAAVVNLSETLAVAETLTKGAALTLLEAATVTDPPFEKSIGKTLTAEAAAVSETLTKATSKTLLEAATVSETLTTARAASITLTETLAIAEVVEKAISITPLEALAVSETVEKGITLTLLEASAVSETFTPIGPAVIVNLSETLAVSETLTKATALTALEAITVTDGITATGPAAIVNLSETLTVTETLAKAVSITPLEVIAIAETISPIGPAAIVNLAETLSVTESVAKAISVTRLEAIATIDAISKGVAKTALEAATITEGFTAEIVAVVVTLTESLAVSESFARTIVVSRTLTESLAVAETISPVGSGALTPSDFTFFEENDIQPMIDDFGVDVTIQGTTLRGLLDIVTYNLNEGHGAPVLSSIIRVSVKTKAFPSVTIGDPIRADGVALKIREYSKVGDGALTEIYCTED